MSILNNKGVNKFLINDNNIEKENKGNKTNTKYISSNSNLLTNNINEVIDNDNTFRKKTLKFINFKKTCNINHLDNNFDIFTSKSNSSDIEMNDDNSSITINNLKKEKRKFKPLNLNFDEFETISNEDITFNNLQNLNHNFTNENINYNRINYTKMIISILKFLSITFFTIFSLFAAYNFYYLKEYLEFVIGTSLGLFKNSKIFNFYIGNSIPSINNENLEIKNKDSFEELLNKYYLKEQLREINKIEELISIINSNKSFDIFQYNSTDISPNESNFNKRFLLDNILSMDSSQEKKLIETMNRLKKSFVISQFENDLIGANFIGKWKTDTYEFSNLLNDLKKVSGIQFGKLNKILKKNPLFNFKNFKKLKHIFKNNFEFDIFRNNKLEEGKIKIMFQKHNNVVNGNNINDLDLSTTLESSIYIFDGEFYDVWVKLIGRCTMPISFKGYLNSQVLQDTLEFTKNKNNCFETVIENNEIQFSMKFTGEIQNGKDFNASKKNGKN